MSNKEKDDSDGEEEKKLALKVKSYTDIQRYKLEKLMKNPEKPVHIPERPKEKNVNKAPEFNHNIMGSSAGAGSGEFHLYRQMRRKEQNRLKVLSIRKDKEDLNEAYHVKLKENEKIAEERTAKKRDKRKKKREKQKQNKKKKPKMTDEKEASSAEEDSEDNIEQPEKEDKKQVEAISSKDAPSSETQHKSDDNKTISEAISDSNKVDSPSKTDKKDLLVVFYSK